MEDSLTRQAAQPIGQGRAGDLEARAEFLEPLGTEKRLPDHQERPGIGQDAYGAGDRAFALGQYRLFPAGWS